MTTTTRMVALKAMRYGGALFAPGQVFHVKRAAEGRALIAARRAAFAPVPSALAPALPAAVEPAVIPAAADVLHEASQTMRANDQTQIEADAAIAADAVDSSADEDDAKEASPPAAAVEDERPAEQPSRRRYKRRDLTAQGSEE